MHSGSLSRRRLLGRIAALTAGGLAAGVGGAAVGRALAAPDDPAGAIAALVADTLPAGASATLLAAVDGEPVYTGAVGEPDGAVHDIGSVTKQFTAAAVLALVQAGELTTDDRLGDLLPAVTGRAADATVEQLLTHTAGLVDALGDDYQELDRDGLLAAVTERGASDPPGAVYRYSNVGYSLLAAVLETTTGQDYEHCLAELLFAPAGMTQTGYLLPDRDPGLVVVEYDARARSLGRPTERNWAADGPYWNLRGNGGLLSTTADILRWHRALLDDTVLSAATRESMVTPRVAEDDSGETHYGYGWVILDVAGRRTAWHNGGNGAAYAELLHTPDGGPMVYWATGAVARTDRWDLEDTDLAVRTAELLTD